MGEKKKINYPIILKLIIVGLLVYSWHLNTSISDYKERAQKLESNNKNLKLNNSTLEEEVERLQDENNIFSSMLAEKEIKNNKDIIGEDNKSLLPKHFHKVPEGNNVYRSNQPSLTQLEYILKNMEVDKVIRLNDTEGTGVSPQKEKELVESMGKEYYYTNAHISYEEGKGYVGSLSLVQPILEKGNVLIHCTAGKDRTGYMVGKFLVDKGWNKKDVWKYTTDLNEWEYYICDGKLGYIKYMEAFYPLDEWCEDYNNDCKYCK